MAVNIIQIEKASFRFTNDAYTLAAAGSDTMNINSIKNSDFGAGILLRKATLNLWAVDNASLDRYYLSKHRSFINEQYYQDAKWLFTETGIAAISGYSGDAVIPVNGQPGYYDNLFLSLTNRSQVVIAVRDDDIVLETPLAYGDSCLIEAFLSIEFYRFDKSNFNLRK